MIDINFLKSRSALVILEEYSGKNPYLRKLKGQLVKNNKISLTEKQVDYITNFHDKEPLLINRIIEFSTFLGQQLQKDLELSFLPTKILVEFMLADTEKAYHVYGKLTRNQENSKMYWLPKTMVIDDPYFESVDIDVDFDKYVELDTKSRTPYEHQKEGIKFLLSRDGCVLADDMGLGKCVSTSELVYTPTGKVKMGELKVGDYVIGSDGKKTKVLEVHPQPKKEIFKVTFNDGYSTTCCKEHMWTVTSRNGSVRYANLTIEQMLDENLELEQKGFGLNEKRPYKFKTYYKVKNGDSKWQIPIVKPIEFENEYSLPIEPYLLGVSLGYGDVTLSHTKFIPDVFKYSNIEDRLSTLQGLMDIDGHCVKSKNGNFSGVKYCSVSEQLVDDIAEIVHSLGGIVKKSSKIGSYKKEDGTKVLCKLAYRLNIKLPEDMNPFRFKMKSDEYNTSKKHKVGRYIKNIESIGGGDSTCIKVDAEDSLFTLNHAIVTHNTYMSVVSALESGAKKILIVCPSSVKINWEREINCFCDETAIVSGRKWDSSKFTIINYDILKNFHTLGEKKISKEEDPTAVFHRHLVNSHFDLVIIDEAHNLKNHKSIRGEIMVDLCVNHNVKKVWLLSGTPIANRPMDYFNLLKLIKAPIADNWMFFVKRYCEGKQIFQGNKYGGKNKKIWITNGASNLEELSVRTRNLILMRKKNDVLDMPDKTITTLFHQLDKNGLAEYNNLWEEYLEERKIAKKRGKVEKDMVELILLRKFIAMEAIPQTIELAKNAIDQGQKVIIFTTFTDELMELADKFGKECVVHNGPMNAKGKQNSIDSFQDNPKINVFIGNIKSAGVGITLTAGSVVIFNSFDWVPGNNEQAEDRAYRIGQTNNVSVYYQLFADTVSTRMWYTIKNKTKIINTIMGNVAFNDDDIINEFMEVLIEGVDDES